MARAQRVVVNQAKTAGLAGMMAEANSAAEMAIEKAAAKRLWLVKVIMMRFLRLCVSARPPCRLPERLQEACQIRESAKFCDLRGLCRDA